MVSLIFKKSAYYATISGLSCDMESSFRYFSIVSNPADSLFIIDNNPKAAEMEWTERQKYTKFCKLFNLK